MQITELICGSDNGEYIYYDRIHDQFYDFSPIHCSCGMAYLPNNYTYFDMEKQIIKNNNEQHTHNGKD